MLGIRYPRISLPIQYTTTKTVKMSVAEIISDWGIKASRRCLFRTAPTMENYNKRIKHIIVYTEMLLHRVAPCPQHNKFVNGIKIPQHPCQCTLITTTGQRLFIDRIGEKTIQDLVHLMATWPEFDHFRQAGESSRAVLLTHTKSRMAQIVREEGCQPPPTKPRRHNAEEFDINLQSPLGQCFTNMCCPDRIESITVVCDPIENVATV